MARQKEFDVDLALDRATDLFWRQGYEATSIRDLEDETGLGRQSLYDTFGDKHQLFLAALDRYGTRQEANIAILESADASLPEIRQHFDALVGFLTAPGPRRACLMTNSVLEFGPEDRDVAKRCGGMQQRLTKAFANAVGNGAREGVIRIDDPEATALQLVTQVYGMTVMAKNGAPRKVLRTVADETLKTLN